VAISYERDDQRRLVAVTVTEPYSMDDFFSAIDRQAAENTWAYAMFYDVRSLTTINLDLQQLVEHVQRVGGGRHRGPVGIAIGSRPEQFRLGLKYSEMTKKIASVEILLTAMQVDDWFARNARRSPP
jgi:hypothetical protein